MVEQMSQPMILQEPHSCGIAEILKISFKFSERNDKFAVLNMFFLLIPFCLLVGADLMFVRIFDNIVKPMELLTGVDPSSLEAEEMVDGILKNVWLLLGLALLFIALFSITSLFSIIAMVYYISSSSLPAQSQKRSSVKAFFMKTGRPWMRQAFAWLYVISIMLLAISPVLISIGALPFRVTGVALIVSCIFLVIFCTLSYVYLAAVWMLSLVMSVPDMDFNAVLVREDSKELIEGRRLQGFLLVLFASFVCIGIYVGFAFEHRKIHPGTDTRSASGIAMLCYLCLMKLFMFMLYSVYYTEFKRINSGEQYEVQQSLGYAAISVVC